MPVFLGFLFWQDLLDGLQVLLLHMLQNFSHWESPE
jgi:hypothetical protein